MHPAGRAGHVVQAYNGDNTMPEWSGNGPNA
jgi:hypothetical protein